MISRNRFGRVLIYLFDGFLSPKKKQIGTLIIKELRMHLQEISCIILRSVAR